MPEYISETESTRTIKAALRQAFPSAAFSVTRGGSRIEWTDNGPTVEQVKSTLIAANCVKTKLNWKDEPYLVTERDDLIWFDRYNAAEREAQKQDMARRIEEGERRRQRESEVVREAAKAKHTALAAPAPDLKPATTTPEAVQAFEDLRARAERDAGTDDDAERQRRPSWAPPLIIDGELWESCLELGLLKPDDKPLVRLWAQFADPKKRGSVLREQRSELALPGITCRGFQLHAGTERGAAQDIMFEAQRDKTGAWRFGPSYRIADYHSPHSRQWEQAVSSHANALRYDYAPADVQRLAQEIAKIDAQDRTAAAAFYRQQQLRGRVVELARDRVLEFAGAPGAQMAMASRLWGHCFNCGKALTDPVSLEMGIGPDCLRGKIANTWINHDLGADVTLNAFGTGMPEDFITATLAAPRPRYREPMACFPRAVFQDGRVMISRREGPGVIGIFAGQAEAQAWIDAQSRAADDEIGFELFRVT